MKTFLSNFLFPIALMFIQPLTVSADTATPGPTCNLSDLTCVRASLPFAPIGLGQILTFMIRIFFVIAGLAALLFLLTGALAWITSGGNKENVDKARDKITNAVIGIILIVAVIAIIVTLEQIVFQRTICFGISCDATIPSLLH